MHEPLRSFQFPQVILKFSVKRNELDAYSKLFGCFKQSQELAPEYRDNQTYWFKVLIPFVTCRLEKMEEMKFFYSIRQGAHAEVGVCRGTTFYPLNPNEETIFFLATGEPEVINPERLYPPQYHNLFRACSSFTYQEIRR